MLYREKYNVMKWKFFLSVGGKTTYLQFQFSRWQVLDKAIPHIVRLARQSIFIQSVYMSLSITIWTKELYNG